MIDSRDITKEFILERITQEEIFCKYLGFEEIKFGKLFINPLRDNDDTPSSTFSYDSRGMLKFSDWPMRGRKNWSIDCFNVVQLLYNCTFKQALIKIYAHFNLDVNDLPSFSKEIAILRNNIKQQNSKKEIKVDLKKWNKKEIEYWSQYYISEETLALYNVYPVQNVWINGNQFYSYSHKDIAFVYFLGGNVLKIYFPYRSHKEIRFIQSSTSILEGSQQLSLTGETCIITKSYKDVMCLNEFGIESVAKASETIILTDRQYEILSNRFDQLYTLFDYDKVGIKNAVEHRIKYNIPILMFDKNQDEKDFSDNLKKYGINHMLDYIEQTKYDFK